MRIRRSKVLAFSIQLSALVMAFAIASQSAVSVPAPAPATPPSPAELEAKVDAIAAQYLSRPGAAGLSIGIAQGGKVILAKGYGIADMEADAKADKDTMFRIGSVTKQYSAAAIMKLIEQGKISLDDNLNTFLPDYPTQGNTVTIRHLLNHTSGIKSYTDLEDEWVKLWPIELTHDELLELVKDKPFDFKPGEQWHYNNTAYYMLGMIIEKISGKSYAQYMQDEFFGPMKLERTRYDVSRDIIKNRAQGYSYDNGELKNDIPLGMNQPGAAGGLLSTGEELVEWSMALTSGKVVSMDSFTQMMAPATLPDGKSTEYGFGLGIDIWEDTQRVSHGGGIHGFNSMLLWLPRHDLHVAVISNGEPINSGRIANEIALAALGVEKAAVKDVAVTPDLTKRIAGNYRMEQMGMDVKIWVADGKAMAQASGEGQGAFAIQWQGADVNGGNEFRASFDHDVKVVFEADGKSFTLHQGGGKMLATRID